MFTLTHAGLKGPSTGAVHDIIGFHSAISALSSMPGGLGDTKAPSNLGDGFARVQLDGPSASFAMT